MNVSLSADDLLVALAVARSGRYNAAARELGVNHTTVSRRIANLEKILDKRIFVPSHEGWELTDVGHKAIAAAERIERAFDLLCNTGTREVTVRIAGPDGFSYYFAAPALIRIANKQKGFSFDLISETRGWRQGRSGIDIEVTVGRPEVHHAEIVHLRDYCLAAYATEDYILKYGEPHTIDDLAQHPLNYYIESQLQVDELDKATRGLPKATQSLRSTSLHVHMQSTLESAGIGILPNYLADHEPNLHRILRNDYEHPLSYWAIIRNESFRNPVVQLVLSELVAEVETKWVAS